MLVQFLTGLLAAMAAALLRLLRGRPDLGSELEAFALTIVLAFIDAFMIAYMAQFFNVFSTKLTFHVFLYTLMASLTIVLYASYKALTDVKVYAVATTPWMLILALIIIARILNSPTVFIL